MATVLRNLSTETYAKINDALKKQGMYDIRLKETEVTLLGGVPEHLKAGSTSAERCLFGLQNAPRSSSMKRCS